MTHSDAGRYAAKHKSGETPDKRIVEAVRQKAAGGELSCAEAEGIGGTLVVSLEEIGRALDLLEIRIGRCQLGLFGYSGGKAVPPVSDVAPGLEAAIRARLAEGRLPCKAAWEIAAVRKLARIAVSSACEALEIRIKPCQLGAF